MRNKQKNKIESTVQPDKMDALKTMAAAISHDFNNILSTISTSVELALGDIPKNSPTYEDLDRIVQTCVESGQYIRDLVSFFKPSTTGVKVFDFASFMNMSIQRLNKTLPDHIDLHVSISSFIKRVKADPEQLFCIIANCIENSLISIGTSKGKINVRVDRSEEPGDKERLNRNIRLVIMDDGPGILPDNLKKIFDPFFTTRPKSKARGLGLSMVYSFVENHNGVINVSSEPGVRTIFEFRLPILED